MIENLEITHPSTGALEIGPVEPARTFVLRQQVLRPHQRVEEMVLLGSGHPDAIVIGATVAASGEVVGTAAVSPEVPPADFDAVLPPGRRWRLRSMATRPDLRGTGIGAVVLDAAIEHIARLGGGVVWCSARTPALTFYERAGFATFGDVWVDELIGPHVMMWRTVPPPLREEVRLHE
ncbi:MAG: GNAT family N-acetyltransferase [Acidimicrobiales bacterium]